MLWRFVSGDGGLEGRVSLMAAFHRPVYVWFVSTSSGPNPHISYIYIYIYIYVHIEDHLVGWKPMRGIQSSCTLHILSDRRVRALLITFKGD